MTIRNTADAIVVGGGIVGVSAAYHLAALGMKDVLLLEKEHLGAGATGKSGALVRMHYANLPEARLALKSLEMFANWVDVIGTPTPFEQCGAVRLVSPDNAERLRANVEMLRSIGVNTKVIRPEELKELVPHCSVDDIGLAAIEPDSGCADAVGTVWGLAKRARELGATIESGIRVERVVLDHGRVAGVETDAGIVHSTRVLLAVGPWSKPFLRQLGIQVEIVPVRVQVAVFRVPPDLEGQRLVYLDGPLDQWLRPLEGAQMLAGSGRYRFEVGADPDDYNESPNDDYCERARQEVIRRLPGMQSAIARGGWAGVVGSSPDGKPILDAAPGAEGLLFAAADSGSSFKTAPAVGLGLAEWLFSGRPLSVDLQPFRASRFAEGEPIVGEFEYQESAQARLVLRQ